MAIIEQFDYVPFDESDPDDYRPRSSWAVLVDPGDGRDARVDSISMIFEVIAPGERIPLHTHPIDEVIVIDEGRAAVRLGDETRKVGPGTVVFIPANTAHGTTNETAEPIRLHVMFPSERIGIRYLERNAAPGTDGDSPQPPFEIDARTATSRY